MRKWLAILAVIFAVAQASMPTSGQAADSGRGKSDAHHGEATTSNAKPADPKAIPQSPQPSNPQSEPANPPQTNNQQSITISEPAPVSDKRDWFDLVSLIVAVLLAAITGAGVLAAWKGLPDFKRQADAAKDAAIAARDAAQASLKQANHMAASERAWVTVMPYIWSPDFYPLWEQGDPLPDDPQKLRAVAHQLPMKIKNIGKTPAMIEGMAAHYIRLKQPPSVALSAEPDYGEIDHRADGRFLIPNDEMAITPLLTPNPTLTKSEVRDIRGGDQFLYCFGIVFYRDVYDALHETRWGYMYRVPRIITDTDKAVFDEDGPTEYNKHT